MKSEMKRDWRETEGLDYTATGIPGILACYSSKTALDRAPMYICAYCGGNTKQIRADGGQYISRRCTQEPCYTLASMTGKAHWEASNGLMY